jgi:hypothetical protein
VNAASSRCRCPFGGSGLSGLATSVAAVFVLSSLLQLPLDRFVCFLERLLVLGNGGIVLDDLRQSVTTRTLPTVFVTWLIRIAAHVRELSNYLLMLAAGR